MVTEKANKDSGSKEKEAEAAGEKSCKKLSR